MILGIDYFRKCCCCVRQLAAKLFFWFVWSLFQFRCPCLICLVKIIFREPWGRQQPRDSLVIPFSIAGSAYVLFVRKSSMRQQMIKIVPDSLNDGFFVFMFIIGMYGSQRFCDLFQAAAVWSVFWFKSRKIHFLGNVLMKQPGQAG